ncbi:LEVG family PEP-CTERM protein [Oscillatoria sp. CS-180]|uniref:LEVG family PEP-CTERM protein n=1 Tax=Oscillatoria sp. CS-180 TaxID=3021720 RepID=UPI00233107D1|nr:LEVG family PEP-CTERM protein [Oscillatoria sp. CS-180]MDB9526682.1 LEVG family PEP-CTERM protein [Oscillatoria sp. CS-180]
MKVIFSKVLHSKTGLAASLVTASVLGMTVLAPSAQAFNLVPSAEGEIKTKDLGCLTGNDCFELDSNIFSSVTSEIDDSTGTRSYLFVDRKGTQNTYNDTVNGGTFTFGAVDSGTTESTEHYWFRPVAVNPDGSLIEGGELEVGTFTFEFTRMLSELNLSFFDTERSGTTSYSINGGDFVTIASGPDANIQDVALTDVKTITLNLGERFGRTGDGVNFNGTASVPEPSLVLGALAATAGGAVFRKRRQAQSEA